MPAYFFGRNTLENHGNTDLLIVICEHDEYDHTTWQDQVLFYCLFNCLPSFKQLFETIHFDFVCLSFLLRFSLTIGTRVWFWLSKKVRWFFVSEERLPFYYYHIESLGHKLFHLDVMNKQVANFYKGVVTTPKVNTVFNGTDDFT